MSTRRGPTRQDCVSWALPDNGRSYHELLHLKKVVCRCHIFTHQLTSRCTNTSSGTR